MREQISIRRYRAADHQAILYLQRSALDAQYKSGWEADLAQIEATYLNNGGEFLVTTDGNQLIGMGAFRLIAPRCAEIMR